MESAPLTRDHAMDGRTDSDAQRTSRVIGMKSVKDLVHSASTKRIVKLPQTKTPFCKFKEFAKLPQHNNDIVFG